MADQRPILKNKHLRGARLLRSKPVWASPLVPPFVLAFCALGWVVMHPSAAFNAIPGGVRDQFYIKERHVAGVSLLAMPCLLFAQLLFLVLAYWNAKVRSWILFSPAHPHDATHVLILVKEHCGSDSIVKLDVAAPGADGGKREVKFRCRNRRYTWSDEAGAFLKPKLPTGLRMAEYRAFRGRRSADTPHAVALHGENRYDIPLPAFRELLIEHVSSPFFVFQMFCVLLWLLDEYWYSPLFTGVMIWVLEAILVEERLKNMRKLRCMETEPVMVTALVDGSWETVSSRQLLPEDVLLLNKPLGNFPCDCLLLEGSVVVNEALLTGESTPLIKEDVSQRADDDRLVIAKDRTSILSAGTKLVQVTAKPGQPAVSFKGREPGALAVVLRTGHETSQGALVRRITANSTSRLSAGGRETVVFILLLLLCGLVSSGYVLYHGLRDPARSRWKLLLRCTIILTAVVPPELPLELTMAVNVALLQLQRVSVFCTEPFRVPFAGALDVCCFDKTGTLTADVMRVVGLVPRDAVVRGSTSDPSDAGERLPGRVYPFEAVAVLTGCTSLAEVAGELAGDSMEQAAVQELGWAPGGPRTLRRGAQKVTVLARHPFNAGLRRMACVVQCDNFTGDPLVAAGAAAPPQPARSDLFVPDMARQFFCSVVKGSPEALRELIDFSSAEERDRYDRLHRAYGRQGFRVLALGIKFLRSPEARNLKRSDVETGLRFAGFAVFGCPIRADALPTVATLKAAGQKVVVITGDHTLTAAWVARELRIVTRPAAFLAAAGGWEDAEGNVLTQGCDGFDLVASGDALKCKGAEEAARWMREWVAKVSVWARCDPEQKEQIVLALNRAGHTTLMCGDGTNDVAALSQAHVGVGLLAGCVSAKPAEVPPAHPLSVSEPLPEDLGFVDVIRWSFRERARRKTWNKYREEMRADMARAVAQRKKFTPKPPPDWIVPASSRRSDGDEGNYAPIVQLGDASLAAPFTARNSSTRSTCHLLRLGRCALMCQMQTYRVIALNCLSSAFSMSVLAHEGVKLSDSQMLVLNACVSVGFLCITRGAPAKELSPTMPDTRLFCPYVVLTVVLQFALCLYCMISSAGLAYDLAGTEGVLPNYEEIDDSTTFTPCLLNSIVFLMITWQSVCVFVANFQGKPFMSPLLDNGALVTTLILTALIVAECTFQLTPLSAYLEIVDLTAYEFVQTRLITIMATNFFGLCAIDAVLKLLFKGTL